MLSQSFKIPFSCWFDVIIGRHLRTYDRCRLTSAAGTDALPGLLTAPHYANAVKSIIIMCLYVTSTTMQVAVA